MRLTEPGGCPFCHPADDVKAEVMLLSMALWLLVEDDRGDEGEKEKHQQQQVDSDVHYSIAVLSNLLVSTVDELVPGSLLL